MDFRSALPTTTAPDPRAREPTRGFGRLSSTSAQLYTQGPKHAPDRPAVNSRHDWSTETKGGHWAERTRGGCQTRCVRKGGGVPGMEGGDWKRLHTALNLRERRAPRGGYTRPALFDKRRGNTKHFQWKNEMTNVRFLFQKHKWGRSAGSLVRRLRTHGAHGAPGAGAGQ